MAQTAATRSKAGQNKAAARSKAAVRPRKAPATWRSAPKRRAGRKRTIQVWEASGPVPRNQAQGLVWAAGCASTDETKPILTMVEWRHEEDGTITIAATDTYRLGVCHIPAAEGGPWAQPAPGQTWLLPAEPVRKALSNTNARQAGIMYLDPGVVAGTRAIEYDYPADITEDTKFPNWRKMSIFNEGFLATRFDEVDVEALAQAVCDAAAMAHGSNERRHIRLAPSGSMLEIIGSCTQGDGAALNSAYRARIGAVVTRHGETAAEPSCYNPELIGPPVREAAQMWPAGTATVQLRTPLDPVTLTIGPSELTVMCLHVFGEDLATQTATLLGLLDDPEGGEG